MPIRFTSGPSGSGNNRACSRSLLGARAEDLALRHLRANGLTTIVRNFRCRMGEIDLVMRDGNLLVFVEVRHRQRNRFPSAAVSVDIYKQRKLTRAALIFLGQNRSIADWPVRFDVVTLEPASDGKLSLMWIQDAFRPD